MLHKFLLFISCYLSVMLAIFFAIWMFLICTYYCYLFSISFNIKKVQNKLKHLFCTIFLILSLYLFSSPLLKSPDSFHNRMPPCQQSVSQYRNRHTDRQNQKDCCRHWKYRNWKCNATVIHRLVTQPANKKSRLKWKNFENFIQVEN